MGELDPSLADPGSTLVLVLGPVVLGSLVAALIYYLRGRYRK